MQVTRERTARTLTAAGYSQGDARIPNCVGHYVRSSETTADGTYIVEPSYSVRAISCALTGLHNRTDNKFYYPGWPTLVVFCEIGEGKASFIL